MWDIASDIGGTFTDLAAIDRATGRIVCDKVLTTPHDPTQGVIAGTDLVLAAQRAGYADLGRCVHGSTLVANALIQRSGARTALVTNRGFVDLLDIGIENRYELFDLAIERPPPLVERRLRFGIGGRVTAQGEAIEPIDAGEVREVAARLRAAGVDAVAVCLLHAYADPAHERAVGAVLAAELPGVEIALSCDVAPEIREYARASTVVASAYVAPLVARYLDGLDASLRRGGFGGRLSVMLSEGGIVPVDSARALPIRLVESGPAAGVIAAAAIARRAGLPAALAFDMGGTTAKLAIVADGAPLRGYRTEVARHRRFRRGSGLPLTVPTVELIEIGAGGGSLAHVDAAGLLAVGPRSAGAEPGPACYGRGGTRPTVTDADLVTGVLGADTRLGGRLSLDLDAARRALDAAVARPLGLPLPQAAAAVQRVVDENMALAARIHAVEHGHDPARFTLIAYGGAGPAHAWRVAQILRLPRVIVPMAAGVMSAVGMLVAPPAVELARSYAGRLDGLDLERAEALFAELAQAAGGLLRAAGVDRSGLRLARAVECRYRSQSYDVQVPLPPEPVPAIGAERIARLFEDRYRALYGRTLDGGVVEVLTWRLLVAGPRHDGSLRLDRGAPAPRAAPRTRRIFLAEHGELDAAVIASDDLRPGLALDGPCVVEAPESTAMIGPGARAEVDEDRNLVVDMPRARPVYAASEWATFTEEQRT